MAKGSEVVVAVGEKKSARPTRSAESNMGGHATGNIRRTLPPPISATASAFTVSQCACADSSSR